MSLYNLIVALPRLVACTVLQFLTKQAPFVEHSLDGKTAFVTGGNGGIGFETAKSLALQGCEVFILCRNPTKAQDAANSINSLCAEKHSQGSCKVIALDLADLVSVRRCVEEIRKLLEKTAKKIDFFFCNGEIMGVPYSKSPQGYEIHFATNHLGHFALVGGIIDLLRRDHSRVIILTGDIAVLQDDASPDYVYNDDGVNAYCRSKICNQAMGRLLHERCEELSVYVVHPGVIDSNLFPAKKDGALLNRINEYVRPLVMIDCEKGAQTSLLCALSDEHPKGSYVHNVFGRCDYHPTAANEQWATDMWKTRERLCKEHEVMLLF